MIYSIPPIDWQMIATAINFYETLGYTYTDVPWAVSDSVARQTFDGEGITCEFGTLVGSAEQGFLAIDVGPAAKLVSCTPCFRDEPREDELYRPWFMKVELYRAGFHLDAVLEDALAFHAGPGTEVIDTQEGKDILINGIEVGSYGLREANGRKWTYGTGLALPRFSVARRRSEGAHYE